MFLDVIFVTVKICSILIMTSAMLYFFFSWVTKVRTTDLIFGFALNILTSNILFPNVQDLHIILISGVTTVIICFSGCICALIKKAKADHSRI